LFANCSDSELLAYGVPVDWLVDVCAVSDEDELLSLTDHLPSEAAEALIELATGGLRSPRSLPRMPILSPTPMHNEGGNLWFAAAASSFSTKGRLPS
jgi:hypothetical protein